MSDNLKNLFKTQGDLTNLGNKSVAEIADETNSKTDKYVDARTIENDRFIPHVDFSSASNFVKFGSAERYYNDAITRIIEFYPYDGSSVEKLKWHNSSSYLDLHIFDNEYPRTNGYVTFASAEYAIDALGNPSTKEYIVFYGGPNTASAGMAGKPLVDTFSGSNVWDTGSLRESNLKFDLSGSGVTVESWVKFGDIDRTTTTTRQTLLDLNNNQTSGSDDAPFGRLWVYLNNSADDSDDANGFQINIQSGSVNKTITAYSINDGFSLATTGSWNHYAFALQNSGSDLVVETYENGRFKKAKTSIGGAINEVTGGLRATIGALEQSVTMMSNSFGAYLDGTGDYFVINSASLTPAEDLGIGGPGTSPAWYNSWDGFSFSTWVKADSNARGTTIFSAGEAVTGGAAAGTRAPWRVMMSDVGTLAWVYAAGTVTTHWYDSSISIEDDEWHHVAFTTGSANSGNGAKLYVDGVGVTTAYPGLLTLKDDYYVAIGADYISGSWSQDWSGSLDEMSVWSRELPAGEVVGMYNSGAPTNLSGGLDLQAWYRCGDSASFGTTLVDSAKTNDAVTLGDPARISVADTLPTVPTGSRGWYKLSGSVDEFRYWKTKRTGRQIGLNWLDQVEGGVNTDDASNKLGVYYKFNEGITTNTATDKKVLDYSGRITNGAFVGYASGARSTGSAIVEASASAFEFKDPILYRSHPDVSTLANNLKLSGTLYDYNNVSSLYSSVPSWIQEEDDDGTLKNLTQIMSSYLDTVYLQIDALPTFGDNDTYTSASNKPYPFAQEMLESAGFIAPELFVDADILEALGSRSETELFTEDIGNVKNRIYENIYNNLINIYKSKGTHDSFRNLIHCFGVDEDVVDLKMYGNNIETELQDNLKNKTFRKNYINFHTADNFSATCYQHTASGDVNSVPYIGSSTNLSNGFGMTFEAEVVLPNLYDASSGPPYIGDPFASASLFGMHTPNEDQAETQWSPYDPANFQVYAVKEYTQGDVSLNEVKFVLTSSNPDPSTEGWISELTSAGFPEAYKDKRWNFAVKVAPDSYPAACMVTESCLNNYKVEFYGVSTEYNVIQHEFYLTTSLTPSQGQTFLSSSKRVYAGAHRTDFTGSTLQRSDARISSVRAWLDVLDNDEVLAHAKDPTTFGRMHPYRQAFLTGSVGVNAIQNYIPRIETRILDWDFALITSASAEGQFDAIDNSSGSLFASAGSGWLGPILHLQHPGIGYGFLSGSTSVVYGNYIYAQKQRSLEDLDSEDMIKVMSNDDVYFEKNSRPINYYFSIEKSMYDVVTRQMLEFFATVKDFNSLIGDSVNRYRQSYKELDKMRQFYFERVQNETIDFEKYLEYYKWFDSALSSMLAQLVPASAQFSDGIRTMVNSHVLERNKYWNKFPMVESKLPTIIAGSVVSPAVGGASPYPWKYGHAPVVEGEFINDYYARFSNCVYAINSGSSNPLGQLGMAPPVASSGWTLSVWIRNGLGPFFSTADGGAHDPEIMINYVNPSGDDGLIQFFDLFGAGVIRTATFPNSHDGNWHNLIVVYQYGEGSGADGSGARDLLALYGDGQALTLSSADIEIDLAADGDIYIGAWATSHAVQSEFAGDMDEFSIWTQAPGVGGTPLVAELYNDGKPWDLRTDSTRLAAWYRMGDSAESATILADSANYSNASYPSTAPQNATAIQVAASPDTVVYLRGGPTGSSPSVNTNCFWWKNRAEPVNSLISSSVASVNADRTSLHTALYQTFDRQKNAPVQFSAVERNDIKSGQNSLSNNHKEKSILSGFSNIENEADMDLYDDYVYISGSELEQFVDCMDLLKPTYQDQDGNPASKKKVFYESYTGHDSIGRPTDVRKENTPLSFYSSSMTASGYIVEIQDVDGFEGLDVTNLHEDSYGSNLEIPMQGPFTEKYVGGYQYRHVDVNYRNDDSRDYLDNLYTRPEGYRIILDDEVGGASDSITVAGPAMARTGSVDYSALFHSYTPGDETGAVGYNAPNASVIQITGDFTIGVWIKTDTDFSADSAGGVLFSVISAALADVFFLYINSSGLVTAGPNLSTATVQHSVGINDGKWHHIVVEYFTGSDVAQLFIDGSFVDGSAGATGISIDATDIPFIGFTYDTSSGHYDAGFKGYMGEMTVFNDGLTSPEVLQLYTGPPDFFNRYGGTPAGAWDATIITTFSDLEAWWRFGALGGDLTADSSGNSHTLVNTGAGSKHPTRAQTPPPVALSLDSNYKFLPFANRTRETYAKRPVNIANIQQVTSSGLTKIGNFEKNYQVVQTSGRKANNLFIERLSISNSESSYVTGVIDYSLPERATNKTVITERFSAPGSGEVMARGTRDYTSEEYSPYNALPWRNLSVRQPLNSLLREPSGQYGIKSGTVSSSFFDASERYMDDFSLLTGSYHKTNRNPRVVKKFVEESIMTAQSTFFNPSVPTGTKGFKFSDNGSRVGPLEIANNGAFSVFFWINTTSTSTREPLFYVYDSDTSTVVLEFGPRNGYLTIETPQGVDQAATPQLNDGEWHLVGFTYEELTDTFTGTPANQEAIRIIMYADGSPMVDVTAGSGPGTTYYQPSARVYPGGAADQGVVIATRRPIESYDYTGYISEMGIWDKTLDETEINDLQGYKNNDLNSSSNGGVIDWLQHQSYAHLSVWWRFGDTPGDGSTMYDASHNGREGTGPVVDAGNSALVPASGSWYTASFVQDNGFVQHSIPQRDSQYAWITASLERSPLSGNLNMAHQLNHATASTDLKFVQHSDYGSYTTRNAWLGHGAKTVIRYWGNAQSGSAADSYLPTDFAGINSNIHEPITSSANILGYDLLLQATTTMEATGGLPVDGLTIVITDTAGTTKTYTSAADEDLTANKFHGDYNAEALAISLAACINSPAGHDGTISATGGGTVGVCQLTQSVPGPRGNTTFGGSTITNVFLSASFIGGGNSTLRSNLNTGGEDLDSTLRPVSGGLITHILGTDSTASILNSLLLHRNGPYQYPSWKQIRTGQSSPIIRNQRKTNIMSCLPRVRETVADFGSNYVNLNDPTRMKHPSALEFRQAQRSHGPRNNTAPARSTYVAYLTESVVTSKHSPLIHEFGDIAVPSHVMMADTYGNNLVTFTAHNDNTKGTTIIGDLGINVEKIRKEQIHTKLTEKISSLDGYERTAFGLPSDQQISRITYRETIFPREQNTFLKKVRQREKFIVEFWNPIRADRTETNVSNSMGSHSAPTNLKTIYSQSMWPLDGMLNPSAGPVGGNVAPQSSDPDAPGELLNRYTINHYGDAWLNGPGFMTASALYTRVGTDNIYSVPWQAASQAGKDPFYYPSYEAYVDDIKRHGKDYTIIPEFRISDYMDYFVLEQNKNFQASPPSDGTFSGFLSLTGAVLNESTPPGSAASSSMKNFFKVYSTTDFLSHFRPIQSSTREIASPASLTLECDAIMKFLPYDGFYPAQRTLKLASIFSQSYGANVEFSGTLYGSNNNQGSFRTYLQPFFTPGIMHNTIKAGVAVDYPIWSSLQGGNSGSSAGIEVGPNYNISSQASFRLPFEALVEPEHMFGKNTIDNEVNSTKTILNSTASWDGSGDDRYKMAMHNFLAESIDFFLKDGQLTAFASAPDGPIGFTADPGKKYIMDIVMRQGPGGDLNTVAPSNMMYNKDSVQAPGGGTFFGPAAQGYGDTGFAYPFSPPHYDFPCVARLSFEPPNAVGEEQNYSLDQILQASTMNYYHIVTSSAWDDIRAASSVTAYRDWMQISASVNLSDDTTKLALIAAPKVSFDAISAAPDRVEEGTGQVLVFQTKYETPMLDFTSASLAQADRDATIPALISGSAATTTMQATGGLPSVDETIVITDYAGTSKTYTAKAAEDVAAREFNQSSTAAALATSLAACVNASAGHNGTIIATAAGTSGVCQLTQSSDGDSGNTGFAGSTITKIFLSASFVDGDGGEGDVIRGMWHQYGLKPAADTGIYLEVRDPIISDVDDSNGILANVNRDSSYDSLLTGSLADLIKMPKRALKLGQAREKKIIKEAVVAIPFRADRAQDEYYYKLNPEGVAGAKRRIKSGDVPAKTSRIRPVYEQLIKMGNYVIPPQFNFLAFEDQDPIAMYIFEFEHELSEKDVTDIWQNLPPDQITEQCRTATATISHDLFPGGFLAENHNDDQVISTPWKSIKWLVFKVKQKANWNYYNKTIQEEPMPVPGWARGAVTARRLDTPLYSYNWPYDFFSMVELVKLEAEVSFESPEEQARTAARLQAGADNAAAPAIAERAAARDRQREQEARQQEEEEARQARIARGNTTQGLF